MNKITFENDPRRAKEGKAYILCHVKLLSVKRLRNSVYGNPRYDLTFYDDNFLLMTEGKTKTDGAIGYALYSGSEGKYYDIKYHVTKNGNIIYDSIIKNYEEE